MLTAEFNIDRYGEARYKSGKRKGIEEGIEKGMERMVLNALKKKMPIKDIAEMTGWSDEKIKELKEKNK